MCFAMSLPETVRPQKLTWKNFEIQAENHEIFASGRNWKEDGKQALSSVNI